MNRDRQESILNSPTAPDGTRRGDPIPGSRFVRDVCCRCKEWIRVRSERAFRQNYCEACVEWRKR